MFSGWLSASVRNPSGFSFAVTDLTEPASPPSIDQLASIMRDGYWGEDYLTNLADRYGWTAIKQNLLDARAGTRLAIRRGDFGEALAGEYLKEVEHYHVPVNKLRFKVTASQTLPGTDCVAFNVQDGKLTEVCYVESKVRTALDLAVAVQGCKQLQKDAAEAVPQIIPFIARQLSQGNDVMAQIVEAYLFSRDTELDTFKLLIFHDSSCWDERVLQNLHDEDLRLSPLTTYCVKIAKLAQLSDSVFAHLGVTETIEDE
jgi:hypothetical protein